MPRGIMHKDKPYSRSMPVDTALHEDSMNPVQNKAITKALSNPNLLDNPWFTVNQRGQSSYTANGYTVDRWTKSTNGTLTVQSDGSVSLSVPSSQAVQFIQRIDPSFSEKLDGKTVTLSALFTDGTIKSGTFTYSHDEDVNLTVFTYLNFNFDFRNNLTQGDTGHIIRVMRLDSITVANTINIRAVKLELGSISTLAMDTAPNYAEELLKCQRYFVRLKSGSSASKSIGTGYALSNTDLRLELNIPQEMRTSPSISYSDLSHFRYTLTTYNSGVSPTGIEGAGGIFGYGITIKFVGTFTASTSYEIYATNEGYIDLSADL